MRFLLFLVTLFSVSISAATVAPSGGMLCTQQCAFVTCPGFTEQVEVCEHIPHPVTGQCYRPCPVPCADRTPIAGCATIRCNLENGVQTQCFEDPITCQPQCKVPPPVCDRVCPSSCGFNPDFQCVTNPITKCGECVNIKATPEPECTSCAAMLCLTGTTCTETNGCGTCKPNVCTERCTAKCSEWQDCVMDETCTPTCKAKSCSVLFNQPCPESANCIDSCPKGMSCIPGRSGTCQPKEVFCRSNEGKQVPVGSKFYQKCNSCTCDITGVAGICDKKGCVDTCFDDTGKGYRVNDKKMVDCNECTCRKGGAWACTEMACEPTKAPKPCECTGVHPMNVEACADGTFANWKCVADANNKCSWQAPQCPTPVQCLINPCDTPDAQSVCIPNSCVANYATGCNYDCKKCTSVARSTTFTIIYGNSRTTANTVANKMSDVAWYADITGGVYKSMYIATPIKSYIKRVSGTTNTWTVTVNFKQASCAIQESNMNAFTRQLQKTFTTSQVASVSSIDNEEQGLVDDNSYTTLPASDAAMAGKQACADGTEIDTAATCPTGAFDTSASSSSIPIAAIIAPIVGGVVLLAIIMTAVVVIRRRQAAQVKTMNNVQQDTQMAQRV